jgi:hypothetical protein
MDSNPKTVVPTPSEIDVKLDQILARIMFHETKLDDLLAKLTTIEISLVPQARK